MLACMVIVGAGVKPPDVFAATTTAAAGSLEMKTASDSINLNAGQSFDVTFSVNAETSGFGGYLTYDNSVFTSVTVVVGGGTTSGKTDNNGEWKASVKSVTKVLDDNGAAVPESQSAATEPVTFTNRYVAVSALPLTGGATGRQWLLVGGVIGGLAVLLIGAAEIWNNKKRLV